MSGLCADTRGGGACKGLRNKMHKARRTCQLDIFLTTACYYYSFNLMIVHLCDKCFGDSSISDYNLL